MLLRQINRIITAKGEERTVCCERCWIWWRDFGDKERRKRNGSIGNSCCSERCQLKEARSKFLER